MFVNSHNLIKFKSPTLYILEHIYLPTHPYQLQLYFISSSNFLTKKELTIQYIHPPFRSLYRNFKNLRSDLEIYLRMEALISREKCSCTIEKYCTPGLGLKYSTRYRLGIWRRLLLEKVQHFIQRFTVCNVHGFASSFKDSSPFCKCRFFSIWCALRFLSRQVFDLYTVQYPVTLLYCF